MVSRVLNRVSLTQTRIRVLVPIKAAFATIIPLMCRKFAFSLVALSFLLVTGLIETPARAADPKPVAWREHSIYWSGVRVGSNVALEQEFTPLKMEGLPNNTFKWTHSYRLEFCWTVRATFSGDRACGQIGFGTHRRSGNTYFANFDLVMYNAVEFQKQSGEFPSDCARHESRGTIEGSPTFHMVCWRTLSVLPNTTYIFRLVNDISFGPDWWLASLVIKETGESINIGKLKLPKIDYSRPLADLFTRLMYTSYEGENLQCSALPLMDTLLSAPRNTEGTVSAYESQESRGCSESMVTQSVESMAQTFVAKFGGTNPTSRDPKGINLLVAPTPTPTPTPTPLASPTIPLDAKPSDSAQSQNAQVKPPTPKFSGVNFVGNKLNINVDIGSSDTNKPNKIYLVAPKLGITAGNPLFGSIVGSTASWSVDFDKILSGTMIPLEVVSERDGAYSDPLIGSYQVPVLSSPIEVKSAPLAPKNFKSRVIGNIAIVTVEATQKAGAIASGASLFANSLGLTKSKAIKGDVVGDKGVIEVPVKKSMMGKRFPVTIFFTNEKGESKPLNATLSIPAAPKIPSLPTSITSPKSPKTVICMRSNQTRAFEGTLCPPGWEKP